MTALEAELEWLRPLVNNQQWDYCVIWKLGDDPSRFIEWGACCCSGGKRTEGVKIKDEIDIGECRDKLIKHPVKTVACEKLAQLPSVIPLYSGIHGEVVISERPKWSNASVSDDEPNGTQVLIPVVWGLIELFTTKQVQKDQKIIDYISAHFKVSFKQESMTEKAHTYFNQLYDPESSVCVENWLPSLNYLNFLPKIPQPKNNSSFEGSPTCSSLSNEHQVLKLGSGHVLKRKKDRDVAYTNGSEKVGVKVRQKVEKGPFKSKNLVTERNRRKRINDGILALRALVPKISKMDRISTLGDAADHIEELLATIQSCYDELRALDEDSDKVNVKQDPPLLVRECASDKTPFLVEIEVIQIGTKDFLVRLICKQTRGGFLRLMEAINSLGLQVTDANVTTLNGSILNALKVEAKISGLEANSLKQSLVELIK